MDPFATEEQIASAAEEQIPEEEEEIDPGWEKCRGCGYYQYLRWHLFPANIRPNPLPPHPFCESGLCLACCVKEGCRTRGRVHCHKPGCAAVERDMAAHISLHDNGVASKDKEWDVCGAPDCLARFSEPCYYTKNCGKMYSYPHCMVHHGRASAEDSFDGKPDYTEG